MVAQKQKVDFTQGKLFAKIFWFVLPIVVTNLLQTFYNAADMMVVSLSSETKIGRASCRERVCLSV